MSDHNYGRLSPGFPDNPKFQISNYDEQTVIDVVHRIGDADYINNHSVNWDLLFDEAKKSIIKKLYSFAMDGQRNGFLWHYFSELFKGAIYLSLEIANQSGATIVKDENWERQMSYEGNANFPYTDVMRDKESLYFAMDCYSTVFNLVETISEACLIYPDVDFDLIIEKCLDPVKRSQSFLVWHIKGGGVKLGTMHDDGVSRVDDNQSPAASLPQPKVVRLNVKDLEPKPLFKDLNNCQKYVGLLKSIKPAAINETGEFILGTKSKSKSVIVAWFDALSKKGVINNQLTSDEERAKAINHLIPNLEINARSMSTMTANYNDNFTYFKDLIERI